MSTRRAIDIWYNITTGKHLNASGNPIRDEEFPYIIYKEKPLVKLRLVTDRDLTAYTGLSAGDVLSASVDFDFDHDTDTMCKTIASGINVGGDWDDADPTQGKISIRLDAYNTRYQTVIGTLGEKAGSKLELLAFETGTGYLIAAIRMPFKTLNIQDDAGSVPPEPAEDFFTREESLAYFQRQWAEGASIQFVDGKHPYLYNVESGLWYPLVVNMVDGSAVIGLGAGETL